MGYMGFGLQRWIYRQRPRRFLSKEQKPIHSEIEMIMIKPFQPIVLLNITNNESRLSSFKKIQNRRQKLRIYSLLGLAFFSLLMIFLFTNFSITDKTYSNHNDIRNSINREKSNAYRVLTISGRLASERGKYQFAYDEFKRADKLYPKAVYHKVYIGNMYLKLCKEQKIYCDETKWYINSLKKVYKNDKFMSYLKE